MQKRKNLDRDFVFNAVDNNVRGIQDHKLPRISNATSATGKRLGAELFYRLHDVQEKFVRSAPIVFGNIRMGCHKVLAGSFSPLNPHLLRRSLATIFSTSL